MNGRMLVALALLALAGCAEEYCPSTVDMFDLADRCHSQREERACKVLADAPAKCLRCRLLQESERNEAIRRSEGCR